MQNLYDTKGHVGRVILNHFTKGWLDLTKILMEDCTKKFWTVKTDQTEWTDQLYRKWFTKQTSADRIRRKHFTIFSLHWNFSYILQYMDDNIINHNALVLWYSGCKDFAKSCILSIMYQSWLFFTCHKFLAGAYTKLAIQPGTSWSWTNVSF